MSDERSNKDFLVEKAVAAGLGTEKFLSSVSEANLEMMVKTVEERDGEIQTLKAAKPKAEKSNKVTTVQDLVRLNKIQTAKTPEDPDRFIPKNTKEKGE